jgi:probable addiction module antidote protein
MCNGIANTSREDVNGALYSSVGTLCLEAEGAMKQLEPYLSGEKPIEEAALPRLHEVYITAARIAAKLRTGKDLAANAELAHAGLERRALDLGQPLGLALEKLKPDHGATEDDWAAAAGIIFAEETRRKRLAALPHSMTVAELLDTNFPPPQWIVPDLLVSGLTILAGAPKLGKSWLALALGSAVGSGGDVLGRYRVERRSVLYLALEDTPRRLKNRLEKIGATPDSHLSLFTQWRSGTEGIEDLDAYLEEHADVKLVLIDTLARFRGQSKGDARYAADYASAASIKAVADKHDCAIVMVHHVRKMAAQDIMDTVSGSNGLNGAADSTWVLTRARGEADSSLFITGRDVEELTLALRFDSACGTWVALGDAAEYAQSRERREVLDAVPLEPKVRKTQDIVALLKKKPAAVSRLLGKLKREGLVFSPAHGHWSRRGGKSVKMETEVEEPRQGTFTLLPDLPVETPTPTAIPESEASGPSLERIDGLSPEGLARLEQLKAENKARVTAEVAAWNDKEAQAALGDIARAKGMTEIARESGLGRESLYRALSVDGNPTFDTQS